MGKSKKEKAQDAQDKVCVDTGSGDVGKAEKPCKKKKGSIAVLLSRLDDNKKLPHDATVELQQPAGTTIATKKDTRKVVFKGLDPGAYSIKTTLSTKDVGFTIPAGEELQSANVTEDTETPVAVHAKPPGALTVIVLAKDTGAKLEKVKVAVSGATPGNKNSNKTGEAVLHSRSAGPYTMTLTLPEAISKDYEIPNPIPGFDMPNDDLTVTVELLPKPGPKIEIADPKIIVVKRAYQSQAPFAIKPHRIEIKLSSTLPYDGEGALTCPSSDVDIYDAQDGTNQLAFPFVVATGDLGGKSVWAEAKKASGSDKGSSLKFELRNGSVSVRPAATEKFTCVELLLDIYKARPLNGSDPKIVEEAKKNVPGRSILEQGSTDETLWAQRAKLVVHKAKPDDFKGKLVLKPVTAAVEVFEKEKPAAGQAALTGAALEFANASISKSKGEVLWVEGRTKSGAFGDSGWTVELEDVPTVEGDRVTMSVLKAELRVFKSKPNANPDPDPIDEADKIPKGRYLHKQDTDKDHGRAKLVIRRLEPVGFDGNVFLTCWDIKPKSKSESKSSSPRVKLFTAEVNGAVEAFETDIAHPTGAAEDLKTVWVEGATNSKEIIDTQIRLGVREVDNANDRASFTVVEFTKIKATIKSTPALNARPGYAAPTDHTFTNSAKYSEDFADNKNPPLVIMRGGSSDIALEVTTIPAAPVDLDITWKAVRNKDDDGSLGGAADLPTVTRDGADKRKATLNTDQKGSFHIRPFIDCNGVDEYSEKEPSIPMNLVLADATIVSDNSAGLNANLTSVLGGGIVDVSNGTWPGTWADCITTPGGAGMTMEIVADVTGGGADGRLGLDKVFGGLINMLTDNQITLTYTEIVNPPLAGAAPTWTVRNRYVLNRGSAKGNYGGTPMFRPANAAPNLLAFPVLDTGRAKGGTGGETATMSRSGVFDTTANNAIGIQYTLRCIDSPGRGFLLAHPDHGGAALTDIHYVQAFRANFCFWTNIKTNRGATGDPCDRVYSVLRTMDWEAVGDWTVTWTLIGGAWNSVLANTNPHVINVTNPTTISPIDAANSNGVEVRPPSGITTAIAWVTT